MNIFFPFIDTLNCTPSDRQM